MSAPDGTPLVVDLDRVDQGDAGQVGGKNAALGEMLQHLGALGVRIPPGYATTASAYRRFLAVNDLEEDLRRLDDGADADPETGARIREAIRSGELPGGLREALGDAYRQLGAGAGEEDVPVAVRSSATAEDLPEASFAGQQESFLNVRGEEELLEAVRACYASLFTDRAIAYRDEQGFGHLEVALSAGVQRMVRSDRAGSGVMFTVDPESGFPDVVVVDAAFGLGEGVVSGTVTPDSHMVFTPLLDEAPEPIIARELGDKQRKVVYDDGGGTTTEQTTEQEQASWVLTADEVLQLARWGVAVDEYYDRAMDIEWAKDGPSGQLYVLQARPETVHSQRDDGRLRTYTLQERSEPLAAGVAIGDAIATGQARLLDEPGDPDRFEEGSVLVAPMTDPDWVPVMRRAGAVVTDRGGRTAHAAIVSRELGIPAIVGCGDATEHIRDGSTVTVSCAEADHGQVYDGALSYEENVLDLDDLPDIEPRPMLNIASPRAAFRWWRLPVQGIGLARMEFIVNHHIGIHPLALTRFEELDDEHVREQIAGRTAGWEDRTEFFVDTLARAVARIAASQHPHPVIVRLSDFKTNEYANLLGGEAFEPREANPMLGFRGAARYDHDRYRDGFALECRALRRAREQMGMANVAIMVPFVRTVREADRVIGLLADHGLVRGKDGLDLYMMCEVPSNVILAEQFADRFDGFSIGSNDLTQLILGVDRDSRLLAGTFDERNSAVTRTVRDLVDRAHQTGTRVGICGQAPSDHPGFAAMLVDAGIDSISLNPDSVASTLQHLGGEPT